MNIDKFDIVVLKDKIVQYLGKEMDNGAIVQDIHCRKELIHIALIQRKATKDETKWFCEMTENSEFTAPLSSLGFKTLMQQGRLLMYYSNLVFNFKFASFQNNFFGIFN